MIMGIGRGDLMDKFTCEYLNELTGYCSFFS